MSRNRHEQEGQDHRVGRRVEITRMSPAIAPPPVPVFSVVGGLSPLLIGPASVPALIVLFAPIDLLDRWPWLQIFTDWMVAHVPYMSGHADSTAHSQLALVTNCLVVALVPLLSLVVLLQTWANYPYLLNRRRILGRLRLQQHFMILLGPPICFVALSAMVMLPGDPSWANGSTTERRGFYSFLAFFMPLMSGWCIGGQVLNLRLFIDTYLRQGASQ